MKIIIGCSWAVGEWDQACNLSGPGFGQLLMLHDQVVNLALGAASNTNNLDRLETFLKRYASDDDDDVYWVVTCPTRCRNADWFLTQTSLQDSVTWLLDQSLSKASSIATTFSIKVHVIGGLCDLDSQITNIYPQLDFVVPSWGQLLSQDYYQCRFMPLYWGELGKQIKISRPDLLREWLHMSEEISMKEKSWRRMSHSFFKTDGQHPDRDGHRKLRDHIWPQWACKF